jgi:hypothetical protein
MSDQKQAPADDEIRNGFFINNGTFSGNFTVSAPRTLIATVSLSA